MAAAKQGLPDESRSFLPVHRSKPVNQIEKHGCGEAVIDLHSPVFPRLISFQGF